MTFKKELKIMAGFNQVVSSFGMQKTQGLYMQSLRILRPWDFPGPNVSTLGIFTIQFHKTDNPGIRGIEFTKKKWKKA